MDGLPASAHLQGVLHGARLSREESKGSRQRTVMLFMLISELWLTMVSMMPASSCDVTFLHHLHAGRVFSSTTGYSSLHHTWCAKLQTPATNSDLCTS